MVYQGRKPTFWGCPLRFRLIKGLNPYKQFYFTAMVTCMMIEADIMGVSVALEFSTM